MVTRDSQQRDNRCFLFEKGLNNLSCHVSPYRIVQ